MAVLSANSTQALEHRGDPRIREFVCYGTSDIFYRGALCFWNATAGITPIPAAGLEFAGICVEPSNGATVLDVTRIKIATAGEWLLLYSGTPAATDVGTLLSVDVSAASDNPADLLLHSAGATGDFSIGVITEFVSAARGAWVNIERYTLATVHA